MSIDDRQQQTTVNVQEKANLIWAIADKLVGVYKPLVLPFPYSYPRRIQALC